MGVVSDENLAALLARARFLAFPARAEFFGYAVAEALASGTPVLAFDYGGPSEQVTSGRSGWLVRSDREFVETARKVYRSGYPPSMRLEARASADRFSLSACAQRLVDALGSGAPPARAAGREPHGATSLSDAP